MLAQDLLLKLLEYSLIDPKQGRKEVLAACELAKARHLGCVTVFPCWMPLAARQLADSDVKIGATVGFPYGVEALSVKVQSAQMMTRVGASELEVFINLSALKTGDLDVVIAEAEELKDSITVTGLTQSGEEGMLKVGLPVDMMEPQEIAHLATGLREADVDFITLFFQEEDPERMALTMRLVRDCVGADLGVKVMTPTFTLDCALQLADLGANRLGAANLDELISELFGLKAPAKS